MHCLKGKAGFPCFFASVSVNLFALESLSLQFEDRPILQDFNLEIAEGSKMVITGPSGSGKSTLLRILLGFVQPNSGTVRFRGAPLTPAQARQVRREVAYVNQSLSLETGTVGEALQTLFSFASSSGLPTQKEALTALEAFGLDQQALKHQTSELSGGEKQRVGLAAALLLRRKIYLLDEPTAALDASRASVVTEVFLDQLASSTIIVVAHDSVWRRADVTHVPLDG